MAKKSQLSVNSASSRKGGDLMGDWMEGNPIGSAIEYIMGSEADIPFTVWDTESGFHSHLFVQQQRCRMRIEDGVLKEVIVAAFENAISGPLYFIWLKEGETATIKVPPYATKPLPIRALKIGDQ